MEYFQEVKCIAHLCLDVTCLLSLKFFALFTLALVKLMLLLCTKCTVRFDICFFVAFFPFRLITCRNLCRNRQLLCRNRQFIACYKAWLTSMRMSYSYENNFIAYVQIKSAKIFFSNLMGLH